MIFYAGEVQHFIQLVFLFSLILIYSRCLKQQLALTLKEGKQAQQQNDFPRARCRYCTKLVLQMTNIREKQWPQLFYAKFSIEFDES